MGQCSNTGLLKATSDTFILAIDVGTKVLKESPDIVKKILADPKVRKSLELAMANEARRLKTPPGTKGSAIQVKALGTTLGKAISKPAADAAKEQVEATREAQKLKEGLKQLECSFKTTPVGVFIDENKGFVIFVAAGLAIGGAVALYTLKTGGWPAEQAGKLAGKLLKFKVLGTVEVGVKDIVFKPSADTREAKMTTFASGKWKRVKADLDLHVALHDDKLGAAKASGKVVVPLGKGFSAVGKGGIGYQLPKADFHKPLTYNLGLGLDFNSSGNGSNLSISVLGFASQEAVKRSVGGQASLKYHVVGGNDPASPSLAVVGNAKAAGVQNFQPSGSGGYQPDLQFSLGVFGRF